VGNDPQLDAHHPWPGLAAYDEGSHAFFHGRRQEALELERLVRIAPLVVLYGRSGLGKSSLLQAGFFPLARAANLLPVYVRIDFSDVNAADAIEQIARRLEHEIGAWDLEAPSRARGESLWRWLHRKDFELWTADNRMLTPLLVLDQFEELFRPSTGGAQRIASVFDALADLAENRITEEVAADRTHSEALDTLGQRYRMLLSFREDYLPELRVWERKVPSLLRHYLRLEPMALEQAERAVQEAGAAVLAPGMERPIVEFVGGLGGEVLRGAPTIEPALLSLTCTQLNLRRGGRLIDAALLARAGRDILEGFYRDALATMPESVHLFIENHLLQGERTRGSYAVDEAIQQRFISAEQLDVLTRKERLLRIETQGQVARVELIHDRLVDVVRAARRARAAAQAAEQVREQERRRALVRLAEEQAARTQAEQTALVRIAEEKAARAHDEKAALARINEEQAARAAAEQAARSRAEADAARLRRSHRQLWAALVAAMVLLSAAIYFAVGETRSSRAALKAQAEAKIEADKAKKAEQAAIASATKASEQQQIAEQRLEQATLLARYGWVGNVKSGLDEALVREGLLADQVLNGMLAAETASDRERRSRTTIEIWAKDIDQGKVRAALAALGFRLAERDAYVKDVATNSLWFGRATKVQDVKLVVLALVRAGVELRSIRPIPAEIVGKRDLPLIQVGADVSMVHEPVWTVERLLRATEFPR